MPTGSCAGGRFIFCLSALLLRLVLLQCRFSGMRNMTDVKKRRKTEALLRQLFLLLRENLSGSDIRDGSRVIIRHGATSRGGLVFSFLTGLKSSPEQGHIQFRPAIRARNRCDRCRSLLAIWNIRRRLLEPVLSFASQLLLLFSPNLLLQALKIHFPAGFLLLIFFAADVPADPTLLSRHPALPTNRVQDRFLRQHQKTDKKSDDRQELCANRAEGRAKEQYKQATQKSAPGMRHICGLKAGKRRLSPDKSVPEEL